MQDSVENDPDEKVREFAVLELEDLVDKERDGKRDVLEMLIDLAGRQQSANTRKVAVKASAKEGKEDLQNLAQVHSE